LPDKKPVKNRENRRYQEEGTPVLPHRLMAVVGLREKGSA
jgi:hypothetical protein